MNQAGRDAIQGHLDYLKDNKYRYELAKKHHPNYITGNGEHVDDVIAAHDRAIAELEVNLQ